MTTDKFLKHVKSRPEEKECCKALLNSNAQKTKGQSVLQA